MRTVTAVEAIFHHFRVNNWTLSRDYVKQFHPDNKNYAILSLERNHNITAQKWLDGEKVHKKTRHYDTWTIEVHEWPEFRCRRGKYTLPKEMYSQDNHYRTPCMLPIRKVPGQVCQHGDRCAEAGHCPIALKIPWYQQDQRQQARQKIRQLGYREDWRFAL